MVISFWRGLWFLKSCPRPLAKPNIWPLGARGWGGRGKKSTCDYARGNDPQNLSIPGIKKLESNTTAKSIAHAF